MRPVKQLARLGSRSTIIPSATHKLGLPRRCHGSSQELDLTNHGTRLFQGLRHQRVTKLWPIIQIWSHHISTLQILHTEPLSALPDDVPQLAAFVRYCGSSNTIVNGMLLHCHIIRHQLELNTLLGNLLVQMYGQCGALEEASAVFASLSYRDHFAWNFIIRSSPLASFCLYQRMLVEGVLPDRYILVGILGVCSNEGFLFCGRMFHACIAGSNLETDPVVGTAFTNMYAKCGRLEDSVRCFDKLAIQDAVSFNALIGVCDQAREDKAPLQLFEQMKQQAVFPDRVTFLNTFSACSSEENLVEGQRLHASCVCSQFESHLLLATALVTMYGKCGSVEDAQRTFDTMTEHDVVSWNALIAVYMQQKQTTLALWAFEEMRCQSVKPDPITLICILDSCMKQGVSLDEDWIQVNIKSLAACNNVEVGMALMNFYSSHGNVKAAWDVFNSLPNRNVAVWNAMIIASIKARKLQSVFHLIDCMYNDGVTPDKFTYMAFLEGCATEAALDEGRVLHSWLLEAQIEWDAAVNTCIVNMYSKCSLLTEADRVFHTTSERTIVSWNGMISALADNGYDDQVISLSQQMLHECILPNDVTFLCILNSCSGGTAALHQGKRIHACILMTQCKASPVVGTAIVSMYGKCNHTAGAQTVFEEFHIPDTVAWSAMLSAFVQGGQSYEASLFFNQMQEEGATPDTITYANILSAFSGQAGLTQGKQMHARLFAIAGEFNIIIETSLICMYCKCCSLNEACAIFNTRLDRGTALWNAMLFGLAESGHGWRAFQLFIQMQQECVLPNNLTFVSVLDVCCSNAMLRRGHQIHTTILHSTLAGDIKVATAVVNMYAKCGSLEDAEAVFSSIPVLNMVSWTAIIAAKAQHGHGKDALQLFKQMVEEGFMPNRATLMSIFSACSHAGLVDEIREFVDFVSRNRGVSAGVDLYNCTVDLFGRAGRLDEAEALITSMPHDPTAVSWTTLLGACRHQLDVERGERAARQLLRLDSQNPEPYVALSDIYAADMGEKAQVACE